MPDEKRSVLDRNVLLPIGAVVATLGSAMWVSWTAATRLASIDERLGRIEHVLNDNAKVHEIQAWIELLRTANKDKIDVPDYPRRQP